MPKSNASRGHSDPVTDDTRRRVLHRDGGCVAHRLGFVHLCADQWGNVHSEHDLDRMTLDHVHDGYGMMGRRAPSDPAHLVTLCWFSHITSNWAPSHRNDEREYLRMIERRS